MISRLELKAIMPLIGARLDRFLGPLNESMETWDITTPLRAAAFLAQVAHESKEFIYMRELASGAAYEGRADLGNTEPGDGVRFRGRGPIQITGRANYARCSHALFGDDRLLAEPELLEQPDHGCMSSGWFWEMKKLNGLADRQDFRGVTRAVNGGYNGLADRDIYYKRALDVLGALA